MDFAKVYRAIDKPFLVSLLAILLMGIIVLASANANMSGDPLSYVKRQAVAILLGFVILILGVRVDYSQLAKYDRVIYVATLLMLAAVLIFGKEVRGTQGWIRVGSLSLQPSEIAKILIIVGFASFLEKRRDSLSTLKDLIPCFLYVLVPLSLILMQPDVGTGFVVVAVMIGMMFVAGGNPKLLAGIVLAGIALLVILLFLHFQFGMWLPLKDYQLLRLTVFLDPYNDGQGGRGVGWNTIQSLVAIGSGGFFGKGLFRGTQVQYSFLPESHTDFIYAVIGEELGFLGASFLIGLYGILIYRTIQIAYSSKDMYGTLLVVGVASMWLFHVFENIGMSIGLMPVTGIPLPFVSYGGSAMLANFMGVTLILAVNLKGNRIMF